MLSGSLAACAPARTLVSSEIADEVKSGASCEDFSGKLSATLAQALIDKSELPTESELEKVLAETLGPGERNEKLREQVLQIYRVAIDETQSSLKIRNRDELLAAIIALDIGDESTPERAVLKNKLKTSYAELRKTAVAAGLECVQHVVPEEQHPSTNDRAQIMDVGSLPVNGAVKVLATAYQSCQAKRIPAVSASTSAIASGGIRITGKHSNGVGQKREYASVSILAKSHYYVREGVESGSDCYDVTKKPLIYDYGGKPYTTTKAGAVLDFHTNAGSGTSALGVDCSGFIFSALAVAGLRMAPGKKLTASQVYGVSASMYMNPASNGLSCMAPVSSTKSGTLQDGDILASTGHIVMIDQVGEDPFGTARLKGISECKSSNISYKNFDFDVLQSAPVKGGVGIDRMRASVYLAESSSMAEALVEYAVADCKARFGSASTVKPAPARLVRHKQTAECKDTPVRMAHESCVASCL